METKSIDYKAVAKNIANAVADSNDRESSKLNPFGGSRNKPLGYLANVRYIFDILIDICSEANIGANSVINLKNILNNYWNELSNYAGCGYDEDDEDQDMKNDRNYLLCILSIITENLVNSSYIGDTNFSSIWHNYWTAVSYQLLRASQCASEGNEESYADIIYEDLEKISYRFVDGCLETSARKEAVIPTNMCRIISCILHFYNDEI